MTNEYWKKYNVFSGGRIETYKNNKILFSIGFSSDKPAAQNKKSLLGKIISIDKNTSEYKLISIGHRNPQGLFYEKNSDIIINTEHGPKGGDEVNINFQNSKKMANFGSCDNLLATACQMVCHGCEGSCQLLAGKAC